MPADDVEFGHVVDLTLGEPSGTELVADAAVGATTLTVDYAGDFEDTGEVSLNGVTLAYTTIAYGAAETDPDIITLADPLAAAALTDDKVVRVSGGEAVADWLLHVSLGDGHPVDIPIPFEQRAMWSNADVSTPIPVIVSADLERLVEVPGRPPAIDQAAIDTPFISLYQATAVTWPDSTAFASLANWTVETQEGIDYDPISGEITFAQDGRYLVIVSVNWDGSSSGRRYIRLMSTILGVTLTLRKIPAAPPDSSDFTQQIMVGHPAVAGEKMRVEAHQTSGAGLMLLGDLSGTLTTFQAVRLQA